MSMLHPIEVRTFHGIHTITPDLLHLTITATRKQSQLKEDAGNVLSTIPYDDIVGVHIDTAGRYISIITYAIDTTQVGFPRCHHEFRLEPASPSPETSKALQEWGKQLRSTIIPGCDTNHIYVYVNPFGGIGKGLEYWEEVVRPLMDRCQVQYTFIKTLRQNHCHEHVQTIPLKSGDVIACLSGDGLVNEALNGFMKRADATDISVCLSHLPGGSGNGLAATLCTPELRDAAHALCRMHSVPFDIFRCDMTQQPSDPTAPVEVRYGFLSVTHSIVADIDIESDRWRWMGPLRFTLKGVQKILTLPHYPIKMEVAAPRALPDAPCTKTKDCAGCSHGRGGAAVGGDTTSMINKDGDYIYCVVSNVTHLGQTFHAAPKAHFCDGMLDVQLLKHPKGGLGARVELGVFLDEIGSGKHTTNSNLEYFKSNVIHMHPAGGRLVIDGEDMPSVPVTITALPAHINVIVPTPSHCIRWQPDWEVERCNACNTSFGLFHRRHHCRGCGLVYDNTCCPVSATKNVRLCKKCLSR
eukprot:PhF_6_TR37041/c0_g1_i1/m.54189/K04718/SPHK; sphingosine kinase